MISWFFSLSLYFNFRLLIDGVYNYAILYPERFNASKDRGVSCRFDDMD